MKKFISIILAAMLLTGVFAMPSFAQEVNSDSKAPIIFDFESDMAGIKSANTTRLQLSLENGNLKCVSKFIDYSSYLHVPLNGIDGEHYNRMRIIAKTVDACDLPSTAKYNMALYYSGTSKTDGTEFAEAEARSKRVYFTNLAESEGKYSNTEYQEYIIDLSQISNWSESTIKSLRIDPIKNASGTLYIDRLEFYHMGNINQKDFYGDVTFFDNRFCYTSGNPRYNRFDCVPKTNEIVTTRLIDYKSPDRTDYIYMKRNDNSADCYFQVKMIMPRFVHADSLKHRYLKMEGDFKADTLQDINFLIRDSDTTGASLDTTFTITYEGAVSGGGFKTYDVVKAGEWFHLLWAMNLDTKTYDVYIDGNKVLKDVPLKAEMTQFNMLRVNLNYSNVVGDLYVDNFNVTGLIKPIVDGVETKTCVIPTDDAIIDFLSDKIGMHAFGNTLHKDGVKTELSEKGIYDKVSEQYYVTADTLNKVFDLDLKDENGEISGDITVKADGTVILKDGTSFVLEYTPKTENGKMYVPIRQFAKDAMAKYVWWFKTGIILISDYEVNIDQSGWVWQSERDNSSATGATIWNDIDYLNGYLQYVRPSIERLKEDYIKTTGDSTFTQHPRIYLTAADFAQMKEKFETSTDNIYKKRIRVMLANADGYLEKGIADYTMWSDSMRHRVGSEMKERFTNWGLAYHMTGDQKYVDAAYAQFKKAATFPDFNASHIIDTGEAAIALAIGYDWFYNAFTPEQREVAIKVVREGCLDVLGGGLYGRITSTSDGADEWRAFKRMSNYNTIVNAGVTLAALATLEYDPNSSFTYIKDSTRSMEYTLQMLPPGGAWTEGPSYLSYALQYLVPFASNVEKNFGTSYNLMDGQGMDGIVDFLIATSGPEGTNNMGDGALSKRLSYESYFYFANRYNKPYASYIRWQDLLSGNSTSTFYDLMYYDFNAVNITAESLKDVPLMQNIKGNELFSIRDSYSQDEANFYFSAHFGTTSGYHQHWDCGTFVLDFLGERWAFDLGADDYKLQNELGYLGYEIFRKRGEAHNMLVIDPAKYTNGVETVLGKFAPIIKADSNHSGGYAYADMSEVYEDAPKMLLGYYIADNLSSVTMRNEFTLNAEKDCIWTMNTAGEIDIDGNTAYVTQKGKTIKLEALCSSEDAVWQDNGNPKPLPETVPADKFANQNQNLEYKQLRLAFTGKAGDNTVTVKISSKCGNSAPVADTPISEWKLPDENAVTITETSGTVTAKTTLNGQTLVLAAYSEDGKMLAVDTSDEIGNTSVSLSGDFYKTKAMTFDNFKNLKPYTAPVTYTPMQ